MKILTIKKSIFQYPQRFNLVFGVKDPGCDRDVIRQGAEMLGWELDDLMNKTLEAMKALPNS